MSKVKESSWNSGKRTGLWHRSKRVRTLVVPLRSLSDSYPSPRLSCGEKEPVLSFYRDGFKRYIQACGCKKNKADKKILFISFIK